MCGVERGGAGRGRPVRALFYCKLLLCDTQGVELCFAVIEAGVAGWRCYVLMVPGHPMMWQGVAEELGVRGGWILAKRFLTGQDFRHGDPLK